ncbi:beta-propeller domain-containing protein [Candidatus Micrarchaeota archaeon]|nr:beta-propeller domain-containing protein [Candidatus Micrarchaeota archaeon]
MRKIILVFGLTAFIFLMLNGCTFIEPHENRSILNLFDAEKELDFFPAKTIENIENAIKLSEQPYYYGSTNLIRFETDAIMAESIMTKASPSDYSTTNVQVLGIDELDIVKIDSLTGNKIYYLNSNKLSLINSFPTKDMEVYKTINTEYGQGLYEHENSIMTLSYNKINVIDKEGNTKWYANLNSTYIDSRMKDGIVYLILMEYPNYPYIPKPLTVCNEICKEININYDNIYLPRNIDAQVFYDIISIKIETGEVIDKKTFMGPYSSNVYVSNENIYFGMHKIKSDSEVMFYYLLEQGEDILSETQYERLIYLNSLNISDAAKALEFNNLIQEIYYGLTLEAKAELQNKLTKGYSLYLSSNPEKKEYTGILKINYELGALNMSETATIPGRLLNQFSMDEYDHNLRAAYTFDFGVNSENGLIILDENMGELSRITGLAEGERIYAVRFMGETGYIVTFRQIDPLFVIDLSNASNPEVKGELKIPGYSTYLHPIGEGKLLGVGQEDWKMKLSLFDVSNPSKPTELDSFITEEGWSEALYNHHAFLWNPNENFVILPMGSKNYVFEIKNNKIGMRKIINENAVRNIYADNVLYVITRQNIIAYSMDDFSEINQISVEGNEYYYGPYRYTTDIDRS